MTDFLKRAQTLRKEAARLRSQPTDDEHERDRWFTRAAELERQSYVEEVMHGMAQEPATEPTPVIDRRVNALNQSRQNVEAARLAELDAADLVKNVQQAMVDARTWTADLDAKEREVQRQIAEVQERVETLAEQDAQFFLGRLFNTRAYQRVHEHLLANQELLESHETLARELVDDLSDAMEHQDALLVEHQSALATLVASQRVVEQARDQVESDEERLQTVQRQAMEQRWESLNETEQSVLIDVRRQHEREQRTQEQAVQARRLQWAQEQGRAEPIPARTRTS